MTVATAMRLAVSAATTSTMADVLSVGSALPPDQEVTSVAPQTSVRDAILVMREHNFSQLPVTVKRSVLGVFTFVSLASLLVDIEEPAGLGELPVDGFLATPHYVRVTDRLDEAVVRWLDDDGFVLIGEADRLQGVLTAVDVLRHLHRASQRFVLLNEIEVGLRDLMRLAVDDAALALCIHNCTSQPGARRIPTRLEEMVFGNYVAIITNPRNWTQFARVFGGTREIAKARLESIRELRNVIFHFKRHLTDGDHRKLIGFREWIIRQQRVAHAGGF